MQVYLSVCLSVVVVANNFYQIELLDFDLIQVSKAYNFCFEYKILLKTYKNDHWTVFKGK